MLIGIFVLLNQVLIRIKFTSLLLFPLSLSNVIVSRAGVCERYKVSITVTKYYRKEFVEYPGQMAED